MKAIIYFSVLFLIFLKVAAFGSDSRCGDMLDPSTNAISRSDQHLTQNQKNRLKAFFDSLNQNQQQQIVSYLKHSNTAELLQEIRTGQVNEGLKKTFLEFPELEFVVYDLLELNERFPGLFYLANATYVINKILTNPRFNPKNSLDGHIEYVNSSTSATTLHYTLYRTIRNLIDAAQKEYEGNPFSEGFFSRKWQSITRFFHPHFYKVQEIIRVVQTFERQIDRVVAVDRIVVQEGLGKAKELALTDDEQNDLIDLLTDSRPDIQNLVDQMRNVFGPTFHSDNAPNIQEIDVRATYRRAKSINLETAGADFDIMNLRALDQLDKILDKARLRQGQKERDEDGYPTSELQIRFGATKRRVARTKATYLDITNTQSNVSYTVEERYTVRVSDGYEEYKDSQGKTQRREKFRYETRYRDRTVYPTFEDHISGSYDTGDRFVYGLNEVKEEAEKMRNNEQPFRKTLNTAEDLIKKFADMYGQQSSVGNIATTVNEINHSIDELQLGLVDLERYLDTTNILEQYSSDSPENFKKRNQALILRYQNALQLLKVAYELHRRGEPELYLTFNTWDFTDWMQILKRYSRNTHIAQGVVATATAGGAGLYLFDANVQNYINSHTQTLFQQVIQIFEDLTSHR